MSEGRGKVKDWSRDPERSRQAILDAAERLFAGKGYEQTSLQEIGQMAGVSRGTPGYFFGSKEQLYGAVLDRVLQAEYDSLREALQPLPPAADSQPQVQLRRVVNDFADFLVARPSFIHLIEREALGDAHLLLSRSTYATLLGERLTSINAELTKPAYRQQDVGQLILSIIAMCWFPLAHTNTFLKPLGIDPASSVFWESRKQHIVDLLLFGILAK